MGRFTKASYRALRSENRLGGFLFVRWVRALPGPRSESPSSSSVVGVEDVGLAIVDEVTIAGATGVAAATGITAGAANIAGGMVAPKFFCNNSASDMFTTPS